MSEEEYEEVTDFKKIGIIIGVIVSVIAGMFFAGVFTPEFFENISQTNIELELPKFTQIEIPPVINEIIKKGDESISEPPIIIETRSQNELLLIEFLRLGLLEEEITDVLTDDCSNYKNSTNNESKYQKLFDVKKELCFGVEGE